MRLRIVLTVLLACSACTVWHVQAFTPDSGTANRPKFLRVTRADGSRLVVDHPTVRSDTLFGSIRNGEEKIRVPLSDVRQLETGEFSSNGMIYGILIVGGLALTAFLIARAQMGGN
jgi:hypothetical protein